MHEETPNYSKRFLWFTMSWNKLCKYLLIGLYQWRLAWNISSASELRAGHALLLVLLVLAWWSVTESAWRPVGWPVEEVCDDWQQDSVSYAVVTQNLKLIVHTWVYGSRQDTSQGERDPADVVVRPFFAIGKRRASWGLGKHECHSCFQKAVPGSQLDLKCRKMVEQTFLGDLLRGHKGMPRMLFTLTLARLLIQFPIVPLKPNWWNVSGVDGLQDDWEVGHPPASEWWSVVQLVASCWWCSSGWFWGHYYSTSVLTVWTVGWNKCSTADDVKLG